VITNKKTTAFVGGKFDPDAFLYNCRSHPHLKVEPSIRTPPFVDVVLLTLSE
jgi:hypothetical protein